MQTITVSPKYQIVIPKLIRDSLKIRSGQKIQVVEYNGRIELVSQRDIEALRGLVKGIDTRLEREQDRVGISSTPPVGRPSRLMNLTPDISFRL